MKPRGDSVAVLTHFGRRSGKPYKLRVWWVEVDDELWIGSMDDVRSWVRNVRANGRAEIDRGRGPEPVRCEWLADPADVARFREAVTRKYPVMSRLLRALFRRRQCAFRTRPADSRQ
jgi:deazaflavin-dependent oxidoreductase (nitroreductase family)